MSGFAREQLPDAAAYFEGEGLTLKGRGMWRTTECKFHGGSDSMRVHLDRGAFVCMACGAKGGDLLAYHMATHGMGFVEAAKALGAYQEDGIAHHGSTRPAILPARALLALVASELHVASVIAADMGRGQRISAKDKARLLAAAGRIGYVARIANAE
jgi:hypothetical protein